MERFLDALRSLKLAVPELRLGMERGAQSEERPAELRCLPEIIRHRSTNPSARIRPSIRIPDVMIRVDAADRHHAAGDVVKNRSSRHL